MGGSTTTGTIQRALAKPPHWGTSRKEEALSSSGDSVFWEMPLDLNVYFAEFLMSQKCLLSTPLFWFFLNLFLDWVVIGGWFHPTCDCDDYSETSFLSCLSWCQVVKTQGREGHKSKNRTRMSENRWEVSTPWKRTNDNGIPPWMKMYFLLKMRIFQCHVSFAGCKWIVIALWLGSTPPPRIPVANEGLDWDSLQKM